VSCDKLPWRSAALHRAAADLLTHPYAEFEGLTNKKGRRKYIASCSVINAPPLAPGVRGPTSLRMWLELRWDAHMMLWSSYVI
jgi:hypothetical protein